MNNQAKTVCIVGGGFGGLYTALYLNNFKWVKSRRCQIILVEPRDNFVFSPLLYEVLTGELERWEVIPPYEKLLRGTKIQHLQQHATQVDLLQRRVKVADGSNINYDYLVLATGSETRYFDIPGVQEHTVSFRTAQDLEILLGKLHLLESTERKNLRIATIGAGASGVEIACKLADRLKGRSSVLLIERGNQILKHFSPSLRKTGKRGLQERGVQLYLNTAVTQIAAEQVTISQNNQNQTLPVDLVIWTAGTKLGEWLSRLDCEKNQASKLIAHPTLQLRGYREVLVLGDIAEIRNGQKFMPATAQVAFQQASCAAKNLKLAMQGKKLRKFFYFHLGDMMTLGHGIGVIDSFSLTFYGKIAGFLRRLIYVQRLPTMRHRLQVLRKLLFGWQLKK